MLWKLILISNLLSNLNHPGAGILGEAADLANHYYRHHISSIHPHEVPEAVIHQPVDLSEVYHGQVLDYEKEGVPKGYEPNTLTIGQYHFPYTDYQGNRGRGEDFEQLVEALDRLELVKVGNRGMESFFGYNNNLSQTGPFAILGRQPEILQDGTEVIVTDDQGLSKGYWMTQTLEFSFQDQINQFYGNLYLPDMVYNGFYQDMIYIQHCRWDISHELLVINLGHRIW